MDERRELLRIIEVGNRVKLFLDDEIIQQVVVELIDSYVGEWRFSKPGDSEAREFAYQKINTVDDIMSALNQRVVDRDLAVEQMKGETE